MTSLYPLKFNPIYKEKIWGGQKIRTVLGKDFGNLANCGESWEISGVEGDISTVAEGSLKGRSLAGLIEEFQGSLVGDEVYDRFNNNFPLLVKFIDARQDLSIQVHPDDALARQRHNSFGKTEMWYILDADPGSTLISGFNRAIDKETYLQYLRNGKLLDLLNREEVSKNDAFYLPAGRVHTIGKGLVLAEIQQSSDVTYRIYDFDRVDHTGQKRDLHTGQALDALDFNHYDDYKVMYNREIVGGSQSIVRSPYFTTSLHRYRKPVVINLNSSFTILIGIEGSATIRWKKGQFKLGLAETVLIPAVVEHIDVVPSDQFAFLETFVPSQVGS